MSTTLPARARLNVAPFDLHDGLFGLVQTVCDAMARATQDGQDSPDLDELLLMSGAAFKTYMPEFNAEEPQDFQPDLLGEFVCNWGAFESLSYYYGWDLKEFLSLEVSDFWRLLQFEIASGRPVVTLGAGGPPRPVLVVGYEIETIDESGENAEDEPRFRSTLEVLRAGSDALETIDMSDIDDFQPGVSALHNWMLIARPSVQPEWAPNPFRQRMRVLRWAAAHAENPHELSQEFGCRYASGHRGFEVFLTRIDALADAGRTLDSVDDAWADFAFAHVAGLAGGRAAAARRLPIWAREFVQDSELIIENRSAFQTDIQRSADAYARVSAALQDWDRKSFAGLRAAYRDAFDAESAATAGLTDALEYMPDGL